MPLITNEVSIRIFRSVESAEAIAEEFRSGEEEGWSYVVVERDGGSWVIEIRDEDGEFIAYGF